MIIGKRKVKKFIICSLVGIIAYHVSPVKWQIPIVEQIPSPAKSASKVVGGLSCKAIVDVWNSNPRSATARVGGKLSNYEDPGNETIKITAVTYPGYEKFETSIEIEHNSYFEKIFELTSNSDISEVTVNVYSKRFSVKCPTETTGQ